jgi:hypothetical protein
MSPVITHDPRAAGLPSDGGAAPVAGSSEERERYAELQQRLAPRGAPTSAVAA